MHIKENRFLLFVSSLNKYSLGVKHIKHDTGFSVGHTHKWTLWIQIPNEEQNIEDNLISQNELSLFLGLAALVQLYVKAINCPDAIPNVQNAWDIFVEMKSCDAITEALKVYERVMESQLKGQLPCDNDELRKGHQMALEDSEGHFMAETVGISTNTTEQYLNKLKVWIFKLSVYYYKRKKKQEKYLFLSRNFRDM